MKGYCLKLLLLITFAFWASGAAKYVHEALEHHGRDASVDDDDDDDSTPASLTSNQSQAKLQNYPQAAANQSPVTQSPAKKKGPCPVCQMLAAMVVDRTAPPVVPSRGIQLIVTLVLLDHIAPVLHASFALSARDPPIGASVQ